MTALAMDVRELSFEEIDLISGADVPVSRETVGAAVGGGIGAAIGSIFGGVGAAVGGAVGALVGAYVANNAEDLAEMQAANRTPL